MEEKNFRGADRSIHAGRDVTGASTGDHATVHVNIKQSSQAEPSSVDIQAELSKLQAIFGDLDDPVMTGFAQKLRSEADKSEPDKSVVEVTLQTALTYAKNMSGFAEAIDKLRPHVEATASWLGKNGAKLISLVSILA